ncbi:alpha/beta fold hydrolase [Flammeovirga aprica]|uniref:Alpha/beta hydrolase n=1 Tax=Flammeovirga aprica JL-4 TaxID=694437 RepID=A0A7X9RZ19_9BACT|nr:alpha/beta fold hydrolase [Flammeovirga aprica]NME71370.1 alpha/beta hydrolase [Flammeovirga aprica JL-4]
MNNMQSTTDYQFISENLYVPVKDDQLFVKRYTQTTAKEAILMIHGSMESGRIFYSLSDKGLAPFLAEKGFDVFVPDFRGRGNSTPAVSRQSKNKQIHAIEEEIPTLLHEIRRHHRWDVPIHVIAHSWGGVWMLAHIARHQQLNIASMCFLATKRSIVVDSFKKRFEVDFVWSVVAQLMTKIYGYFPVKKMGIGQENESRGVYEDCKKWVYATDEWIDPSDQFDYLTAFKKAKNIPPTLYMTGKKEYYLGHQKDVRRLMKEVNNPEDKFMLLSKENGYALDYDHVNICTAKEAVQDHFPIIFEWLKNRGKAKA